jgi:hypothetical protein
MEGVVTSYNVLVRLPGSKDRISIVLPAPPMVDDYIKIDVEIYRVFYRMFVSGSNEILVDVAHA